jgi:D-alanine-D-alanine ligase
MTTIAVVFGGPSPEHDISILTGLQAARLLAQRDEPVACVYWSRTGEWLRVPGDLEGRDFAGGEIRGAEPLSFRLPGGLSERRRLREQPLAVDVVVNCCHGGPGEDGTLATMAGLAGLRVTGPRPGASALVMDKLTTAAIVDLAGLDRFGVEAIPTTVVGEGTTAIDLKPPWVIKPRFGGSSLGVEVGVEDVETAVSLARAGTARSGAVAQEQLVGWSDLNIAVRTHPEVQVSAIERPITAGAVYGYREKYLGGADGMESAVRELPADLPGEVAARVEGAALAVAETVGLTGVPRVDFLYDGADRLALCEVNAVPGSLGLYLWAALGIDRAQVVADLVAEARAGRVGEAHWSAATDGAALRAAATVASKLR